MAREQLTFQTLREIVRPIAAAYPIRRITLFGSRAAGTQRPDSDIDLIVEFSDSVSLLTISRLRCQLEEALGLPVDLIHGPLTSQDMIQVQQEVELYAA